MQNVDELLKRLDNQYGLEYHSETEDGFTLYQESKVRKDRICQDAILTIRAQQAENAKLRQTLEMLWMQYNLFVDVENDAIASKCKNYVEAALTKETP